MTHPCEQTAVIAEFRERLAKVDVYQEQGLEFRDRVEKRIALILILLGALLAGVNGSEILAIVAKTLSITPAVASEASK